MTRLETAQMLREHDNFIILTHRRPDGDTTGCAAGLCLGLRALGKSAWVLRNRQLTPKLAPFAEGLLTDTCPEDATVISVDIASLGLFSFDAEALHLEERLCFAIDHHGSNDLSVPKLVEPDSAACGEIILELLELLGVTLTRQMAEALYLAISTDTGCFKYSNTSALTHRLAAACMDCGIPYAQINRTMFDIKSRARIELERLALQAITFHYHGRCAVMAITNDMIEKSKAGENDLEGLPPIPRQIEGVWVGVTLRQKADGSYKISLRTGTHANAAEICRVFGGGGHPAAAGCTVNLPLSEAIDRVVAVIGDTVDGIRD